MPKRRMRRGLVELLTVVAIIALLISILLPSIAKARELAKKAAEARAAEARAAETQPAQVAKVSDAETTVGVFSDSSILIFLIGTGVAGLAWGCKALLDSVNKRSELILLEILSDGTPRGRRELLLDAKSRSLLLRAIPGSATDALCDLVAKDRVSIINGHFLIEQNQSGLVTSRPSEPKRAA